MAAMPGLSSGEMESTRVQRAADSLLEALPSLNGVRIGIVLGSGLGSFAQRLGSPQSVPFSAISGFPAPGVAGHAGRVVVGSCEGVSVAVLQGRVHLYEGWSPDEVVLPVRTLVRAGITMLLLTNAAGGIHPTFQVGDLMLLIDHLNLTGRNPLTGPHDPTLGLRFPDMTRAYDPELGEELSRAAQDSGVLLHQGIYAALPGPSYETPAEIRMLRTLGADAVGMSTALETIAAHHMGARVAGLSLITNAAAGSVPGAVLSHDEVTATAREVDGEVGSLMARGVARWSRVH